MSDLARFLPLSHRPPHDAAASSDRRSQMAAVLTLAVAALRDAPDHRRNAFVHEAGLSSEDGSGSLSELADTVTTGRRRSIRELTAVCRAYLTLPGERAPLPFDVAGAVALASSATAPFDRRAAIGGHTVRASDAGWAFGQGPEISASADEIVAFLTGISDTPPRRTPPSPQSGQLRRSRSR